jgi:hypothetical protein
MVKRRGIDKHEKRLYKTLKLLDLERSWIEWKAKDRISELQEAGVDLEIYKERTENKIKGMEEREI